MAGETDARSDKFKEFAGSYFTKLVEGVAGVYGNKPSNAVKLSPDEEIDRWLQPTSPAALKALELNGTMDDAIAANTLWAHAMRGEQIKITQQLQQQGATAEEIHTALAQQGLTDRAIFATCRKYADELAKTNGHGQPKQMVQYHKRMAEKARTRTQPSIVTLAGEENGDGTAAVGS